MDTIEIIEITFKEILKYFLSKAYFIFELTVNSVNQEKPNQKYQSFDKKQLCIFVVDISIFALQKLLMTKMNCCLSVLVLYVLQDWLQACCLT